MTEPNTAKSASSGQPREDVRGAAQHAFLQGEDLRKQGGPELLRQAIEKYDDALALSRAVSARR